MIEEKRPDQIEVELVSRAKAGDKEAFGELVRLYQKAVYYLAYRFTRNHDTADELTQESFVRAYQAMERFVEGKSFRSWIFAIAANLAINQLKRQKRELSLDEALPDEILADTRPSANPAQQAVANELERKIEKAVARLPEEFRTVFILRTYEELSYEEIADLLKIEIGTVMSRLFRARARLKEELKDYLDD